MDWYHSVFELIDMRSFSNLWFWIALAVMWSSASHRVLGVPWDMAQRARRTGGGQPVQDFEDLVRIHANRLLHVAETSGILLAGLGFFVLTVLLLSGFVYGHEFAQAVFLLAFPMSIVGVLSIAAARAIRQQGLAGEALYRRLSWLRLITQVIGVISIFVTAMWGMLQNMTTNVLG